MFMVAEPRLNRREPDLPWSWALKEIFLRQITLLMPKIIPSSAEEEIQ